MTRTLLISEIFPPRHGGSGRWFVELYGRLSRANYVIAAGSTAGDNHIDELLSERLDIERIPLSSPSWGLRSLTGLAFYWRSYKKLVKLCRERQITQIHCGRCLPEGVIGWLLSKRLRIPYLCFVHGEDIQTASESRELTWMIKRVFRGASVIIANSHNSAALLVNDWQVDDSKIEVLHPGMDASKFVPAPINERFLQKQGWHNKTVILSVGRLQRRKGHDMLIQALSAVRDSFPNILYSIIGNGEERERLEQLVSSLHLHDHVQFLDEVDDSLMIQCYQQCTVFALPNRADGGDIEGFGMVLAEAQACGKPVLAGDSGGTRETMIVGETGIIADCTNPASLTVALLDLLARDDLEYMGKKGRDHVVSELDWGVHVTQARLIFDAVGER